MIRTRQQVIEDFITNIITDKGLIYTVAQEYSEIDLTKYAKPLRGFGLSFVKVNFKKSRDYIYGLFEVAFQSMNCLEQMEIESTFSIYPDPWLHSNLYQLDFVRDMIETIIVLNVPSYESENYLWLTDLTQKHIFSLLPKLGIDVNKFNWIGFSLT